MADHVIYELRRHAQEPKLEGLLHEVATCEGDAVAFALATLREEEQLTGDSRVGILYKPDADGPGVWLINPWAAGREAKPCTE